MADGTYADSLSLSTKLVTGGAHPPQITPKVFVHPFRLAFKKGDTDDVSWIEVRSLAGLRNVAKMLDEGKLTEIDRFTSMEMQLWGHLAEHAGFLRQQSSPSALAAGIQPLGEEPAALAEDLASIMGGSDIDALNILDAMKSTLTKKPIDRTPIEVTESNHEFVKKDGINLTEKGEDTLRELVLGRAERPFQVAREPSPETIAFEKEAENAVQIFRETPEPTDEEREQEAKEAVDCQIAHETGNTEGEIKTGPEAVKAGRLVADVGRGLDNEADKAVRAEAAAAVAILEKMISRDEERAEADRQVPDLLERYNTTMEELLRLATTGKLPRPRIPQASSPAETDRLNRENLRKLMREVSDLDLAIMVGKSEAEQLSDEERARRMQERPSERSGADHYRPREDDGHKSNDSKEAKK